MLSNFVSNDTMIIYTNEIRQSKIAILDCLISFVYIIIVSFDTKLDFFWDIAHLDFLWYRLFYLVYVLLCCL